MIDYLFLALIAAVGLFVLLESVPVLYMALKIMGGLYLCFLAYKMYAATKVIGKTNEQEESEVISDDSSKGYTKCF